MALLRSAIFRPQALYTHTKQLVSYALCPPVAAQPHRHSEMRLRVGVLCEMLWSGPTGERYLCFEHVLLSVIALISTATGTAIEALELLLLCSRPLEQQLEAFAVAFGGFGTKSGGENADVNPQSMTGA